MRPVTTTGFILALLWVCLLHPNPVGTSYAEILWGQCHSFCLTRHEARHKDASDPSETIPIPAATAVKVCKRDKYCKWCLFACDRPRESYHQREICLEDCQNSRARRAEARQACNDSCWFIWRSSEAKFGQCEQPSAIGEFGGECVHQCRQQDLECDGMNKCCPTACGGRVCLPPLEYDVLPAKPGHLKFRTRRDGGLLVEWPKPEASPLVVQPVVYVLRWWCPHSATALHSITTKCRIKLHQIQPGSRCTFMVAAVNIKGSQGFTAPQEYYLSLQSPSPPVHLETSSSESKDGQVDVVIQWQPPLYTYGLEVDRYLVFWSDSHPEQSTSISRLHMHKKTVSKDRTSYTVRGLDPAILIFVQVKAVVKWNGQSLRGKPVSTFIETYSPPTPGFTGVGSRYPDNTRSGSSVYNITVHTPVFHNARLTALVTWSVSLGSNVKKYSLSWGPTHCEGEAKHRKTRDRLGMRTTSLKQEFRLFNLRSECVYEVVIHAVNFFGELDEGTPHVFTTPRCDQTEGRTSEVACPPKVTPPATPAELSVRFKFNSGCICQAVLSWEVASEEGRDLVGGHSRARASPRQYKVVWGPSRPPEGASAGSFLLQASTIVYNSVPYQVTVPGGELSACMTYLERSTHYTAQLEAVAGQVKSSTAIIHFVTPDVMDRCYGDSIVDYKESKDFLGSVQEPSQPSSVNATKAPSSDSGILQQGFMLICASLFIYSITVPHAGLV